MGPTIETINSTLDIQRRAITDEYSPKLYEEPPRRKRYHTIISVDDHVVEPPNMFEGRMPAKFRDRTPRVVDLDDGSQAWLLDGGVLLKEIAINAVAGRSLEDQFIEPTRFDHLRPAMWDIDARIHDMDIDGIYASMNFPSAMGFGGVRLTLLPDPEFVLAVTRAWNDWHIEEWAGRHPGRIIPCQLAYLFDPKIAAEEVRKNAERGCHSLTFPEAPHRVGLPSLHTDYWDPLWAACEETKTVISLHAGSSGLGCDRDPQATLSMNGALFCVAQGLLDANEWLFSRIAVKFPDIRICLSEGGIGWIVGFMDRLQHDSTRGGGLFWKDCELTPKEMLQRNFWFCMIDDPTTLRNSRHVIGVDRIVIESDYPHSDTSWPDTQEIWRDQFEGIPADEVERMAWKNASELYSFPVPVEVQQNPDAY